MHQRDFWVFGPVGANLLWCVVTVFAGPPALPSDGTGCALLALFVSGVAMLGIFGFVVHDIGPAKSFAVMLGQTAILIVLFAQLYMLRLHMSFWDGLYISVSTWTSLGYAELRPEGEMRIVTAVQAITGYVFLGLLISLLSNVAAPRGNGSGQPAVDQSSNGQ